MAPREREIIERAITKFEIETGFKMSVFGDADNVDIIIKIEGQELTLNAEVRLFINKTRLGIAINRLKNVNGIPLLITGYVNPELMKTIEENNINFIDTVGNAYIKVPPLFIKIKGNKRGETKKVGTAEKPMYAAELQTIFTLLCNPGIEKNPMREIAELAGVTHGTVHLAIKNLQQQGYLQIQNGIGKLINKQNLLEKWATLYPENLKPKFIIGKYEMREELLEDLDYMKYDAIWGGEVAAARMTNYLQPYIFTLYIGGRKGEFILRNRLRKDPKGNLLLMEKFWKFNDFNKLNITHPILIYADLLATGDPRNIEAAKIIYEKEIVRYLQQD
jgi:hypothetical protein